MNDNKTMLTIGTTDRQYVVYLTNGDRGAWRTATVAADGHESARRLAEQTNPGWRAYGVQLGLDDEIT